MQMNIYRTKRQNLGFWETLIPAVAGAPSGGVPGSSVSPSIQTSISPQISPNFQQQFQPSNSAMTAGTQQIAPSSMTAPTQSAPGSVGTALPSYSVPATVPGNLSPNYATGAENAGFDFQKAVPWIIGIGIAVAIKFYRDSKK